MTLAGMIQFWHPGFEGTQWQIYLIYVGTATVTGAFTSRISYLIL